MDNWTTERLSECQGAMVAPMMEVKNSGADPPAAIQVASNHLKYIQMSDVYMTILTIYDYMQLYASNFYLLGNLWAAQSAIPIYFILSFLGPKGLSASKLLQLHLELGSMHHTRDQ